MNAAQEHEVWEQELEFSQHAEAIMRGLIFDAENSGVGTERAALLIENMASDLYDEAIQQNLAPPTKYEIARREAMEALDRAGTSLKMLCAEHAQIVAMLNDKNTEKEKGS